jgi:hypothetical protein
MTRKGGFSYTIGAVAQVYVPRTGGEHRQWLEGARLW